MRKQIYVNLSDGKWICDFVEVQEGEDIKKVLEDYENRYDENIKNSMDIIRHLLPCIIHISVVGD